MTNELRAHDLAIAYVNQAINPVALVASAKASGHNSVCFDLLQEYMKVYVPALKEFERHFPSEK